MRLFEYTLATTCVVAVPACFPKFEDRPYLLSEPTVLAVRSTPAELPPNLPMALDALVATPDGTATGPLGWAFCTEPRRAEERTSVTADCLNGDKLAAIADPTMVTMPMDACFQFGPVSPPTMGSNDVPRRPSDPDPTGGYYVPVRVDYSPTTGAGASSFGFVRVRCDLAGATRDVFDAFQMSYTNNVNPQVGAFTLAGQAQTQMAVSQGATVDFALALPASDAEAFPIYTAIDGLLSDAVETLTVSWYVTDGTLTRSKQTLTADELAAGAFATSWTAPATAGTVYGWAILRDDRGGVDWQAFELTVQ